MKLKNILLASMLTLGLAYADAPQAGASVLTAELQGSKGNKEGDIKTMMGKLGDSGFSTVAANTHIENFYYEKFKEKGVENISFYGLVNKEKLRTLLLANPDFGAFAPFNFLQYKTLDTKTDDNTWYGHLNADTMLEIVGEKNEATQKEFKEMMSGFDAFVNKELKPTMTKKFERKHALVKTPLTKLVLKFDEPDDLEEFVEDFVADHDGRFATHNFIIAGFIDFKFEYDDRDEAFDNYDAYWVSMLCHFEFSNSIFNRGTPEAGLFAPCSIYFYIPKGKNELHVGYSSVENWIYGLNFKDEKQIAYMRKIDAEVVETFKEMGFEVVQTSVEKTK